MQSETYVLIDCVFSWQPLQIFFSRLIADWLEEGASLEFQGFVSSLNAVKDLITISTGLRLRMTSRFVPMMTSAEVFAPDDKAWYNRVNEIILSIQTSISRLPQCAPNRMRVQPQRFVWGRGFGALMIIVPEQAENL